ncbi:MAG: GntR family transcriptional regulator [Betaproteobacteria bacterium]|nr:GntR family transcriptional regulator [Betaproteobacteria bacterium]
MPAAKAPPRPVRGTESETVYAWSPSPAAQTLSLPEQIAERIGNTIIRGGYEPGARIQEQEVADQFHVSRGPVREALRILERDGLVQIHARRGAQVTQLNVGEVNDLFELRISLLGLAARLAAERRDPDFMARMRASVETLSKIAKSGDADAYTNAVYRHNLLLADGSGNRFLRNMVFSLAHQTLRYSRLGLSTPKRHAQSARNWRTLLAAVQGNEPKRAQEAAEKLVRDSRDTAVKMLRKESVD